MVDLSAVVREIWMIYTRSPDGKIEKVLDFADTDEEAQLKLREQRHAEEDCDLSPGNKGQGQ